MYTGWFEIGLGNEIGNNMRFYQYAQHAAPTFYVKNPNSPGVLDALNDGEDYAADMTDAPWYDPDSTAYGRTSSHFLGIKITDISGLIDSTWRAEVTEGITDGGVTSDGRYAAREIRVRAFLLATDDAGIEYGIAWLVGAMKPGGCGMHAGGSRGASCGTSTLTFFSTCPVPRTTETDEEWAAYVQSLRRHVHGVKLVSGPLRLREHRRAHAVGLEVEFTFIAENPHVYTDLVQPDLDRSDGSFVLDSPYNLVPYPSAELVGPDVVVSENWATNPSFEVDLTGWGAVVAALSGSDPVPFGSFERVPAPIEVAGDWAAQARILGDSATEAAGAARITLSHAVSLAGVTLDYAVITAWISAQAFAGASSSVDSLAIEAEWSDGADILHTDRWDVDPGSFGSTTESHGAPIPPGATSVVVRVISDVTWASSADVAENSDIRVYLDAVGVIA